MALGKAEIQKRFGHSAASIEGPNPREAEHAIIREAFMNLADTLNELVPDGRGKSVAFTELETASMWFHKATAESD